VIAMTEKKKIYPNPRFSSVEEEDKYWAIHSPLDEGYAVANQKEKQKRSSFLTIRLTGGELIQLRDLSSARGMGPSTFIRTLIKDVLTSTEQTELAPSKSAQQVKSIVQELVYDRKAGEKSAVKDKAIKQYAATQETFCILELSKAPITQEQMNALTTTITLNILDQFITNTCIKVIAPGDVEFAEIKRITKEGAGKAKK